MQNNVSIGYKIRCIRTSLNMSQERFGAKIGISGKTISSYETGRSSPPLRVLKKMSKKYSVDFIQVTDQKQELLVAKLNDIKSAISYIEATLSESLSL